MGRARFPRLVFSPSELRVIIKMNVGVRRPAGGGSRGSGGDWCESGKLGCLRRWFGSCASISPLSTSQFRLTYFFSFSRHGFDGLGRRGEDGFLLLAFLKKKPHYKPETFINAG